MHDAAVNRGRGGGAKILFVDLPLADVVAGMDVDVAHAGKDQAIVAELDLRTAQSRADLDNPFPLDADLARRHAVWIYEAAGDNHRLSSKAREAS